MSQYVDGNEKSFEADAAIEQYARVKLDADGKITTAGLADKEIGTAMREAFAAGDVIPVRLRSAAGTHKMIAADALTAGDPVFSQASGKVGDTEATAFLIGIALEDAAADGDILEVLYNAHGDTAAV